ncbi:MAG: sugar O-acyltransferase [Desulfobulbaceae bacterium BRH_c16a]|nr:MAG: sugar O-acyltransferase [Desulfobulbaceae bacterium BRH_c16a]
MPKKLVILGTNGNCIDMLDMIESINSHNGRTVYECIGFLDDNPSLHGKTVCGIKILGQLTRAGEFGTCSFVNGIGSPSNYIHKDEIISKTGLSQEKFETLIHPSVTVSRTALVGMGAVVFENVSINSNVRIGSHVIILPNSIVSHNVVIGDYTCIAGGVCISGGTKVGRQCYLGSNCSIIGNIAIGDFSLVGMGSVVLDNVREKSVVVGNPAKVIRYVK